MDWAHTIAEDAKYLSHPEVYLIQFFARCLPRDAVCVNIGTGPGTSIVAVLETRPDLYVYAIDDHKGIGDEWLKKAGVRDRTVDLIGDSQTMLWNPQTKIDFLFVDGDHQLEGITADINNLVRYARGIVMFHDYNDSMGAAAWPDVQKAVDAWAGDLKPIAMADSLIVFDVRQIAVQTVSLSSGSSQFVISTG